MTLTLYLALLTLGAAAETAVAHVALWGPPLLAMFPATTVRTAADSVRAGVRTLSALRSPDTDVKPLTCPDTHPDMSADTCPDVSGRRSPGGH